MLTDFRGSTAFGVSRTRTDSIFLLTSTLKYLLIYSQHRKTVDISVFSEHFSTNVQNFIFFMFITFRTASLESGSVAKFLKQRRRQRQ